MTQFKWAQVTLPGSKKISKGGVRNFPEEGERMRLPEPNYTLYRQRGWIVPARAPQARKTKKAGGGDG